VVQGEVQETESSTTTVAKNINEEPQREFLKAEKSRGAAKNIASRGEVPYHWDGLGGQDW